MPPSGLARYAASPGFLPHNPFNSSCCMPLVSSQSIPVATRCHFLDTLHRIDLPVVTSVSVPIFIFLGCLIGLTNSQKAASKCIHCCTLSVYAVYIHTPVHMPPTYILRNHQLILRRRPPPPPVVLPAWRRRLWSSPSTFSHHPRRCWSSPSSSSHDGRLRGPALPSAPLC